MKKGLFVFLILLVCCNTSKSANLFNVRSFNIFIDSTPAKNKTEIHKKIKNNIPFQGKRVFCSADSDAKYAVTIKANNVLIVIDNKKITGVYKKDKLFTNDPEEIEYRKFAPKNNYGKFYVIATDYFSVLNPENSEYRYFTVCK
jgi:predicted amidohydrolase